MKERKFWRKHSFKSNLSEDKKNISEKLKNNLGSLTTNKERMLAFVESVFPELNTLLYLMLHYFLFGKTLNFLAASIF